MHHDTRSAVSRQTVRHRRNQALLSSSKQLPFMKKLSFFLRVARKSDFYMKHQDSKMLGTNSNVKITIQVKQSARSTLWVLVYDLWLERFSYFTAHNGIFFSTSIYKRKYKNSLEALPEDRDTYFWLNSVSSQFLSFKSEICSV